MSSDSDYSVWQQERQAAVLSPTGNLALVNYQPVQADWADVTELPVQVRLAPGQGGVFIRADRGAGVTVDGAVADGEVFVGRLQPSGTPVIRHGSYSADVFSLDGSDYELRLYDRDAEQRRRFERIACYDHDPNLILTGTYSAYTSTDEVPWEFTRSSDSGHLKNVPGVIHVTVQGQDYHLLAFTDGPLLVLVFADGTTGKESYAPGRFLKLPLPSASGAVTLDFNRAFIPPCGFSYSYSCPVPPPQNRIAAPIRGGEREVVWKEESA